MYRKFFGLKERPFQLVPNPAYLFLSKSHEEALAHLTYAISQGDGFVEITGEVGTGKTTLCRVFLESLNDNTEAAYIFNPKLDSVQLLKAVNDDFGINSESDTIKDLIDILNSFLLEKKAAGKKIILLIDEAQNLTTEVLEQLRLLSNLETSTSKLIQIILVGQPELRNKLESYELRQLGQRITLSCHLMPLTSKETSGYINHRLYVASGRSGARFSWGALREIYKNTGGIPRRINIVCDRAMLTAYVLNSQRITRSIVKRTLRELGGGSARPSLWRYGASFAAASVILVAGLYAYRGNIEGRLPETPNVTTSEVVVKIDSIKQLQEKEKTVVIKTAPPPEPEPVTRIEPVPEPEILPLVKKEKTLLFSEYIQSDYVDNSRKKALITVLHQWSEAAAVSHHLEPMGDHAAYFKLGARQNGFGLYRSENDLSLVLKLNLPAVFEFYIPDEISPVFLVCTGLGPDGLEFDAGSGIQVRLSESEMATYWTGISYIPWKNFLGCYGTIPGGATKNSVLILKMLLNDIGYDGIDITPVFDEKTKQAVIDIQKKNGIEPDGKVGVLTKIVIYNEKQSFRIPHLLPGTDERG